MRSRLAAVLVVLGAAVVAVALVSGEPARAQDEVEVEPGSVERGEALYRVGCQTCHGPEGEGVERWPPIADSGAAAADFQLRTGRMPYTGEPGQQAQPKPPAYDEQEIRDLVAYVDSLGDGPAIADVETREPLLQRGRDLFALNCAPCHGATGNGGAVGGGAIAWPITDDPPRIVAGAMVSGPGQMPVFALPDDDLDAVVTYVEYLGEDATDPGGLAIGGIGPVPEGFVAWLVGMGLLALVVYFVGREWDRKGTGR